MHSQFHLLSHSLNSSLNRNCACESPLLQQIWYQSLVQSRELPLKLREMFVVVVDHRCCNHGWEFGFSKQFTNTWWQEFGWWNVQMKVLFRFQDVLKIVQVGYPELGDNPTDAQKVAYKAKPCSWFIRAWMRVFFIRYWRHLQPRKHVLYWKDVSLVETRFERCGFNCCGSNTSCFRWKKDIE